MPSDLKREFSTGLPVTFLLFLKDKRKDKDHCQKDHVSKEGEKRVQKPAEHKNYGEVMLKKYKHDITEDKTETAKEIT